MSPVHEDVEVQMSDQARDKRTQLAEGNKDRIDAPIDSCPQCGHLMIAIRGSRDAICSNCGFKDSCCY